MCGRLVNLDTVARVIADYYHLKTDTQLAALDEALSKVPAVSVVGGYRKDHVVDPNKMVEDLISRQAAIDAIEGVDWYHINKNGEMVHGANPDEHQAWYKAEDIYKAVGSVPSAQPDMIRCGQCKYAEVADSEDSQDGYTCQFHRGSIWFSGSYCSWAERRQDE